MVIDLGYIAYPRGWYLILKRNGLKMVFQLIHHPTSQQHLNCAICSRISGNYEHELTTEPSFLENRSLDLSKYLVVPCWCRKTL